MSKQHRGPHPQDSKLFAEDQWEALRCASHDLSWLIGRGYAQPSALELIGNRYSLTARQRLAVGRVSCTDKELLDRQSRCLKPEEVLEKTLLLDGFNIITGVEAAIGGGILLRCRDGCVRDMASMHGNYRVLGDTLPALDLIDEALHQLGPSKVIWYLDQPVSNSGRLKNILEERTSENIPTEIHLVPDPDLILREAKAPEIAVSADRQIIDGCEDWFPLTTMILERMNSDWIDFSVTPD